MSLTPDEIDILLDECRQEITEGTAKLTLLMLERDSLRRKIKRWKEEREMLELIKSGSTFNEPLTTVQSNTIKTLQRRYNLAAKKYNKIFPEEEPMDVKIPGDPGERPRTI